MLLGPLSPTPRFARTAFRHNFGVTQLGPTAPHSIGGHSQNRRHARRATRTQFQCLAAQPQPPLPLVQVRTQRLPPPSQGLLHRIHPGLHSTDATHLAAKPEVIPPGALSAAQVPAVPDDAPYRFGLGEAVSPLRLRGMVGMLARIKRQVAAKSAA